MKEAHPAAEVVKQTAQGRKGAALREALGLAAAPADERGLPDDVDLATRAGA